MSKAGYVLDSYALLAFFQGEVAGAKVRNILKEASSGRVSVYLSGISLGEVYYIVARKKGQTQADEIIEDILRLPIELIEVTMARILDAARVKARHPISYADAFAASGAKEFAATVVTGDPEFKQIQTQVDIFWL